VRTKGAKPLCPSGTGAERSISTHALVCVHTQASRQRQAVSRSGTRACAQVQPVTVRQQEGAGRRSCKRGRPKRKAGGKRASARRGPGVPVDVSGSEDAENSRVCCGMFVSEAAALAFSPSSQSVLVLPTAPCSASYLRSNVLPAHACRPTRDGPLVRLSSSCSLRVLLALQPTGSQTKGRSCTCTDAYARVRFSLIVPTSDGDAIMQHLTHSV
jgi:hypothetical protein